jgi:heat shock protein HslJ
MPAARPGNRVAGPEGIDWTDGEASVRLEGGRLSGSGGVNRLTGTYDLEGSSLVFSSIATTMMAGSPERMDREQRFLADLARAARWSLDGDQLLLGDAAGAVVLRLRSG